jgi:hypothetical protein
MLKKTEDSTEGLLPSSQESPEVRSIPKTSQVDIVAATKKTIIRPELTIYRGVFRFIRR